VECVAICEGNEKAGLPVPAQGGVIYAQGPTCVRCLESSTISLCKGFRF
jgi:S-adenosylmethionine:tRNA-ribosyltransferase-isomerase (queuine synthetase)